MFQCLASRGKLLYYSFASHWNGEGREAAAEYVAVALGADAKKMSLLDDCNVHAEAAPAPPATLPAPADFATTASFFKRPSR